MEIWTDVPGMFSANPREVPDARLLTRLDYAEAQEICTTGAKVLHPRAIKPCREAGVPIALVNVIDEEHQNFRAPVDESSGNLSCGLPLGNAMVRIVDERGHEVPPGETGEILVSGPMVTQEYLNNPTATDESLPGGELRTGDIGFMNPQGWVFVIDRKKDMINASGFKVWPREIEDVLYCHPDIREVAVVGETDDYRGENVVAYVGLYGSHELTAGEVIQYCRERLASYKVPRKVYFVEELPKTASGKIRRREVRETGDELRLHAGE